MSGLTLNDAGVQRDGRWLVRHVSLELEPGCLTGVIGPNGAGKSTALRMLAGLWKPSEGSAELDGKVLSRYLRRELAKRLSFVPQGERIQFGFSVWDVVSMGRHAHLGRFESPTDRDHQAVERALERADALHLAERPINELSGGEAQRVLIARALATESEIILLDEPTASLDIDHALEVMELARGLCDEGKAIAMALHDLNAVARWADKVALVHEGALDSFGPTDEVLDAENVERVFGVQVERLESEDRHSVLLFERAGSGSRR